VYSDRPQQLLVDFGRQNDIRAVNMVPDFREASQTVCRSATISTAIGARPGTALPERRSTGR
jgi:hypothetical protein